MDSKALIPLTLRSGANVQDLGYFRHSSTLLEQAISSIRGIVEIEQAERDRSLEQTIQVLGVGLGTGAIASLLPRAERIWSYHATNQLYQQTPRCYISE